MTSAVLVWITIASASDETIHTGSTNGSSQDTLAFGTGPSAGLFACAEGFGRTCQGGSLETLDDLLSSLALGSSATSAAARARAV
jgi:hypothetical protein